MSYGNHSVSLQSWLTGVEVCHVAPPHSFLVRGGLQKHLWSGGDHSDISSLSSFQVPCTVVLVLISNKDVRPIKSHKKCQRLFKSCKLFNNNKKNSNIFLIFSCPRMTFLRDILKTTTTTNRPVSHHSINPGNIFSR